MVVDVSAIFNKSGFHFFCGRIQKLFDSPDANSIPIHFIAMRGKDGREQVYARQFSSIQERRQDLKCSILEKMSAPENWSCSGNPTWTQKIISWISAQKFLNKPQPSYTALSVLEEPKKSTPPEQQNPVLTQPTNQLDSSLRPS